MRCGWEVDGRRPVVNWGSFRGGEHRRLVSPEGGICTLIVLMLVLLPGLCRAAFEEKPAGARNAAMGGVVVAGGMDGWAGNPAHLLQVESALAGVSLTPGLFNLPELSLLEGVLVVPFTGAAAGFSFARFGGELYRETEGALSLAAVITEGAALGASARLLHLAIPGYGSASSVAVDLGLVARLGPAFTFSMEAANCTGATIGLCREEIPRSLGAAIEWNVEHLFSLVAEIRKERSLPAALTWGGEVSLVRGFSLRLGGTTDYPGVSAGAGLAWMRLRFDYAWRWHSSLGGTHTLSLTVEDLF